MESGSHDGIQSSSGESTPEPPTVFVPEYSAKFTDKISKDGDIVKFVLNVYKESVLIQSIERVYEDFEYLEHCVITDQPSNGIIIPPLPPPIAINAQAAENLSKKQLGRQTSILLADDFRKECLELEKYLQLLLCHPILGRSTRLLDFLLKKAAPPHAKIHQSLISKLSNSLEARKSSHPDCDDFFHKERAWLIRFLPSMTQASEDINKIVYAQMRIAYQHELLASTLKLVSGLNNSKPNKQFAMLNLTFLGAVESLRAQYETKSTQEHLGLADTFGLWARYAESENNMLLKRTLLMIEYQSCNRALDKAKPNRKEAAEKMKLEAECQFARCSDVAKGEVKRFHRMRCSEMLISIQQHTRTQVFHARNMLATLKTTLAKLQSLEL